MSRLLPALILTIIGSVIAGFLAPAEALEVNEHLVGFPDSVAAAHLLRPKVLWAICLVPALAAIYYGISSTIDRYLIKSFISTFTLCFVALFSIWLISDLSNHFSDFQESGETWGTMQAYYLAAFPGFFVAYTPYSLLLAMLYSLGTLSRHQEIVSIIQTGRGVARLILPLLVMGGMVALVCLGFNYHWAPASASYQDALLEEAKEGQMSRARDVVFMEKKERRLWLVGSFPFDHHHDQPLRNVIIKSFTADGQPEWRLNAKEASWDSDSGSWSFKDAARWDLQHRSVGPDGPLTPKLQKNLPNPFVVADWPETPWQLIKPGLEAEQLGIPGLYSWLVQNRSSEWGNRRQFLTQWYYRWAQPGICFSIVLLSAPLGIVFSRRGAAGSIAFAIFLCIGMLFSAEVFLALGESGYLPPIWAAWGTNILATILALYLIQRRLVGLPIYQTIRKLFPGS